MNSAHRFIAQIFFSIVFIVVMGFVFGPAASVAVCIYCVSVIIFKE